MPSLHSITSSSATHPSFIRHRHYEDTVSSSLKLNLSALTPIPVWASLPTPPMSGTPPPGPSVNVPQYAGKRRKREDSPLPSVTTTNPQIAPCDVRAPTGVSPRQRTPAPYGETTRLHGSVQSTVMPSPVQMPWDQPTTFTTSAGIASGLAQYGPPLTSLRQPPPDSPRSTRKTKAHVASACVNCKKKHLRCDEERPCRRCVQSGKESTCIDVTHKKRGRPPLKPDDGHGNRMIGRPVLPPLGPSRGVPGPSLPPLLPSPNTSLPFPSYAQPTIAQSMTLASGQFAHPPPPSFPNIINQRPSGPPPTYAYPSHLPGYQHYPSYHAPIGPPPSTQHYPAPLFPRQVGGPPSVPSTGYTAQGLLLPPILPAPARATLDPAYALPPRPGGPPARPPTMPQSGYRQQQQQQQQQPSGFEGQSEGDERDPKRPKMDIQGILHPR